MDLNNRGRKCVVHLVGLGYT